MPKNSYTLYLEIAKRYQSFEETRVKMETLVSDGLITQKDIMHVYEGLFLNAYIAFESLIEDLFMGLLVSSRVGLEPKNKNIVPRVVIKTHKIARETIMGPNSRGYITWLPIKRTIKLAGIYFRGGRPFSCLNDQQKGRLTEYHYTRNAIAHNNRHSINKFNKSVIADRVIPMAERKPAGYLRGLANATQTRLEITLLELLNISRALTK